MKMNKIGILLLIVGANSFAMDNPNPYGGGYPGYPYYNQGYQQPYGVPYPGAASYGYPPAAVQPQPYGYQQSPHGAPYVDHGAYGQPTGQTYDPQAYYQAQQAYMAQQQAMANAVQQQQLQDATTTAAVISKEEQRKLYDLKMAVEQVKASLAEAGMNALPSGFDLITANPAQAVGDLIVNSPGLASASYDLTKALLKLRKAYSELSHASTEAKEERSKLMSLLKHSSHSHPNTYQPSSPSLTEHVKRLFKKNPHSSNPANP